MKRKRRCVEPEDKTLKYLQRLNPKVVAAREMLQHYDANPARGSFILQIWGHQGCGKQMLVSALKKVLPATRIVVDFDHAALPRNIMTKSYARSFFYALVDAMQGHIDNFQKSAESTSLTDRDFLGDAGEALECSSEDDLNDSPVEPRPLQGARHELEEDNLMLHLDSLRSKRTAGLSPSVMQYFENRQKAPTRLIIYEIVSLLRYLSSRKERVLIIIRHIDVLIRTSQRLLYSILNLMADASAVVTMITTTHVPQPSFEKRIVSRYNPFYLPMAHEHPDTEATWSEILKDIGTKGSACSKARAKFLLQLDLQEKVHLLFDAGWRIHVLQWILDASKEWQTPEEGLQEIFYKFDPHSRFVDDCRLPSLAPVIKQCTAKSDVSTTRLIAALHRWLESVQVPLRECVILAVATAITLEQSTKSIQRSDAGKEPFDKMNDDAGSTLKPHLWLRVPPDISAGASTFTLDFLVQSIFPREGSVFQTFSCAEDWSETHEPSAAQTNWLFCASTIQELFQAFKVLHQGTNSAHAWMSDGEWHNTIVWLLNEYGLLVQVTPAVLSLHLPPFHTRHLIAEKLMRVHQVVGLHIAEIAKAKVSCDDSALQVAVAIVSAVRAEIERVTNSFENFFEGLVRVRNAL